MIKYSKVAFFFEGVGIPGFSERDLRKWIIKAVKEEGREPGQISFIFCTDEYLHQLNLQFLNHDTLTDIITFDYCLESGSVSGDLFISIDRVGENSNDLNVSFFDELKRVMIHGVLHLLGYTDKDAPGADLMRQKENYYLTLLV